MKAAFLLGNLMGITSPATKSKICELTAIIKKYKLLIKKRSMIKYFKSKNLN